MIARACYRVAELARGLRAGVRRLAVATADDCDTPMDRVVTRDELDRAFRELTPEHRTVLVLRHFVGLPIAAVAETLEIPVGTAASRLHYAARCLRAAFEADARNVVAWRHPA
jgi:DNA-directed RNA polymerase specialized sigma24 family protein